MLARLIAAAATALSLAACSESTLPEEEWLQVRRSELMHLSVRNRGDAPVHFIASDRSHLALLDCTPDTCQRVAPGESVSVYFADIYEWDEGDAEAIVRWWVFDEDTGRTVGQGSVVVSLL
jgi:hypothetical protein